MKVDVLGTAYEIKEQTEEENPKLKDASGLCEMYTRTLVVRKLKDEPGVYDNIEAYGRKVLRHEIIHAFLAESGLRSNCSFAENEELVDWIAIQFPKLAKAFAAAGCAEE